MSKFSEFITLAIRQDNITEINGFPVNLLGKGERAIVEYIKQYEEQFGSVPLEEVVLREVDSAKDILERGKVDGNIKQMLTEAKRQNFYRASREATAKTMQQEAPDFGDLAQRILGYKSSLRLDGITSLTDGDTFIIPTSRLKFKYDALEQATQSLLAGELALFLGRPKTKKTYITLDMCVDAFVNQGKRVYITSLEMTSLSLKRRIKALIGGYNPKIYRTGTREELTEAARTFKEAYKSVKESTGGAIIFPTAPTQTVSDVVRDIETYTPDVVFVDSIYAFKSENGQPISGDWTMLGGMIGMLKAAAILYDIQILCTSQLKRGAGNSGSLSLDDIAYADSFGQTCDLIVGFTEEKGDKDNITGKEIEVTRMQIIASREGGKDNLAFVKFDWDNCRIIEHKPKFFLQNG